MMNDQNLNPGPNFVVITRYSYNSIAEFYAAVQTQVMLLLNAGYAIIVRYTDSHHDAVMVEYSLEAAIDAADANSLFPIWVTAEEAAVIGESRIATIQAAANKIKGGSGNKGSNSGGNNFDA